MDKIKQLMVKCGLKPEISAQLCEQVDQHIKLKIAEHKTRLEADYNAKTERAKKICVEETERGIVELARKVQIFCEAKTQHVEQSVAKQTAMKESAAATKLSDIQALLEGAVQNGQQSGSSKAEVEQLKRRLQQVSEERNRAVTKANRANAIAGKVMENNRLLQNQVKARATAPVSEARQPQRLDSGRRGQATQTTRPTLLENQDRRPVARRAPAPTEYSVDGIASAMDRDGLL